MKRKMKKLTSDEIDLFQSHFTPVEFSTTFDIVYEDQVPITGLLLLEGEAALTRKNKIVQMIEPGTLLGIRELIGNEVVKQGCRLSGHSKVILIRKTEIMELVAKDSALHRAILP